MTSLFDEISGADEAAPATYTRVVIPGVGVFDLGDPDDIARLEAAGFVVWI